MAIIPDSRDPTPIPLPQPFTNLILALKDDQAVIFRKNAWSDFQFVVQDKKGSGSWLRLSEVTEDDPTPREAIVRLYGCMAPESDIGPYANMQNVPSREVCPHLAVLPPPYDKPLTPMQFIQAKVMKSKFRFLIHASRRM